MSRKIFVVRGSEDGNLGCYSNAKRAFARAQQYLNQNGPVETTVSFSTDDPQVLRTVVASYRNVCQKLVLLNFCEIEIAGDRGTAEIEIFYLNQ